jgi:hypothetical protein
LEDHLHVLPHAPELFAAKPGDVDPIESDGAFRRLDQAEHGPSDRRLTAARFADQAERLAPLDSQIDPVYGTNRADAMLNEETAGDREMDPQALDL